MNLSIQNLIDGGQKILGESGIENSKYETKVIIEKTLKISSLEIIINPKRQISEKEKNKVLKKIYERKKGKPISKIFGVKEFFSREFITNSQVLDPRPETEILLESTVRRCLKLKKKKISILELGVGSGCLIISILLELKKIQFSALGVDLSDRALMVAIENVKKFNLEKYIDLKKSNWFSRVYEKFDVIISNPPYVKTSDIKNLDKGVKYFDPFVALNGGKNGLESYEKIADKAKSYLNNDGIIILEMGFGQHHSIKKIFNRRGYKTILEEKDLQGVNRVVGFS